MIWLTVKTKNNFIFIILSETLAVNLQMVSWLSHSLQTQEFQMNTRLALEIRVIQKKRKKETRPTWRGLCLLAKLSHGQCICGNNGVCWGKQPPPLNRWLNSFLTAPRKYEKSRTHTLGSTLLNTLDRGWEEDNSETKVWCHFKKKAKTSKQIWRYTRQHVHGPSLMVSPFCFNLLNEISHYYFHCFKVRLAFSVWLLRVFCIEINFQM